MKTLAHEKCTPSRADTPHVTHEEVTEYLVHLPGWQVTKDKDLNELIKVYYFKDWMQALEFTNKVGEIAEQNGHHPAVLTEWGRVTVRWWTHVIKGLSKNDFIMAAKCETLASVEGAK